MLGKDRVTARVKTLKGTPKLFTTRLDHDTEENLYNMQDQIPQQAIAQINDGGDF